MKATANLLDRAIGFFSPQRGLVRALAAEVAASAQMNRATAHEGENKLEKETTQAEVLTAPVVNAEVERAAGVTAERLRTSEIRKISQAVRLDEAFISQHVDAGTSVEVFRKAALDKLADRDAALPATRSANASITHEEADTRREAMTTSLLYRADPHKYKLEDSARQYVGLSLIELAKECLQANGVNPRGLSRMKVAELAFQSTSDFPLILAASANKFLRAGYELVPSLWRQIAAPRSAPDFKVMRDLQFDSSASLEKVNDGGEFHRGSLVESQETWQLATYGKVLAITRQAIINDDLGAFTRVPMLMGQEVALLEADLVWGVITANGALSDGFNLFSNNHANLVGTGTAISVDNLGILRKSIRLQTSIGGKTLNLQPKYLVVPVAKEQLAMQYTSAAFTPTVQAGINPWTGSLTPIAEARLDANSPTAWYLFCDPGMAPVVIYAYLQGNEGPFTETRLGFEVDGTEFKVRQDFGVGAIDYRGAAKNAGA
jgi:hypothetical protein